MTITAPPRPPGSHTPNVPRRPHLTEPDDHEALIEEARKRARRRRRGYGACALLGAAAVGFLGFHNAYGHAGANQASRGETPRSATSPSASTSGQLAISDIGRTTVVNGDGTNLHVLLAPRSQVTFSPDGRALTYLDRLGRIVSVTQPAGRVRTIVRLGADRWAYPRWSPDGRAAGICLRRHRLWADQHRGHQPRRLSRSRGGEQRKSLLPLVSGRTMDRIRRPLVHADMGRAAGWQRPASGHRWG